MKRLPPRPRGRLSSPPSRPARSLSGAAADSSSTDGNRLQITFTETPLSVQERPGLGMRQTMLSGTQTFKGLSPATELVGVTIDLTVTPCGAGSSTSTILRRDGRPGGRLLVLKSPRHTGAPPEFGIRMISRYKVDGDASTGIFGRRTQTRRRHARGTRTTTGHPCGHDIQKALTSQGKETTTRHRARAHDLRTARGPARQGLSQ